MKIVGLNQLLAGSTYLLAVAVLFFRPAFSETLTWTRGPGGCTFLEGNTMDKNSFVLRQCSRSGEKLIKPVAVVFLKPGIVAVEMPHSASDYNGIWCSREAAGLKKGVHYQCGSEGWKPLP